MTHCECAMTHCECAMTHPYIWPDSFICNMTHSCMSYTREVAHLYVWRDSFICNMTHSCMSCHIRVRWLIHICDTTWISVAVHVPLKTDAPTMYVNVTWLIHIYDTTYSYATWLIHVWHVIYAWGGSFVHVRWLIYIRNDSHYNTIRNGSFNGIPVGYGVASISRLLKMIGLFCRIYFLL